MSFKIDTTVAYNLKSLRIKHNMTQQELANRANISKQTISNLEKGQGATSKTIERLAECLDVSPLTFYQEVPTNKNFHFKRVSAGNTETYSSLTYINEISNITNRIIKDTKNFVYYQQVSPIIKNFFQNNTNNILDSLNIENNSHNCHIMFAIEENLMSNIKESIFNNTDEELDDLIEEE